MHFLRAKILKHVVNMLPALVAAGSMTLSAAAVAQSGAPVDTESNGVAEQASPSASTAGRGARAVENRAVPEQPVVVPSTEAAAVRAPDLTTPTTEAYLFSAVDYTNDYRLTWEEMVAFFEAEIREGGWNRFEFIHEFDTDSDEFLDEEEYSEFLARAGLEQPETFSPISDVD